MRVLDALKPTRPRSKFGVGIMLGSLAILSTGCYNSWAAAQYAQDFFGQNNTDSSVGWNGEYYALSDDCTDYVSQALYVGGIGWHDFPGPEMGSYDPWFGITLTDTSDYALEQYLAFAGWDQNSASDYYDTATWTAAQNFLVHFAAFAPTLDGNPALQLQYTFSYSWGIPAPSVPGGNIGNGDIVGYDWMGETQADISHLAMITNYAGGTDLYGNVGTEVGMHTKDFGTLFWTGKDAPGTMTGPKTTMFIYHVDPTAY